LFKRFNVHRQIQIVGKKTEGIFQQIVFSAGVPPFGRRSPE